MQKLYNKILEHTSELSTVCIACSGGIDSMFLTKICSEIPQKSFGFGLFFA